MKAERAYPTRPKESRTRSELSRRDFGKLSLAFFATAAGGAVAGPLLIPGVRDLMNTSSEPPMPPTEEDHNSIIHASAEQTYLDNAITPVEHHDSSVEIDRKKNDEYAETFPDHTLRYELKIGDEISSVTFHGDQETLSPEAYLDISVTHQDTVRLTVYPTEPEHLDAIATLTYTDVVGDQPYATEVTEFPVQVFAKTPDQTVIPPRVFSETDVELHNPSEHVLARAETVAAEFAELLPDVRVCLFDNTTTVMHGDAEFYYDPDSSLIKLPVQYFTHPEYPDQGVLGLSRLYLYALATTHTPFTNASERDMAVGDMETMIWHSEDAYKAILRHIGPASLYLFNDEDIDDYFRAFSPSDYNKHFEQDIVFSFNMPPDKYLSLLVNGMTVFRHFPADFLKRLDINDRFDPKYLSDETKQLTVKMSKQIFAVLEAITNEDNLAKVIPAAETIKLRIEQPIA